MEVNSGLVKRNIGFSPPDITELEIKEVIKALESGNPVGLQQDQEQNSLKKILRSGLELISVCV